MASGSKAVVLKDKPKKKKQSSRVLFWSPECRYSVIIDRVKEIDWKCVEDEKQENKVNVYWIDVAAIHERFRTIQPWQIINHFPGMPNIARKNRMGQNLNKLLKVFPKEYSFYPRTWILPGEMADFRNQFDNSGNSIGNKIYIIKPDAGCQGRGIYLTKTFEKVPLSENVVAQLYIKKPLLIDNFKFDLRLYCMVTSVKPLRVYLFHDGLVRMCTEEYVKPSKANLDQSCMHLTNYAVNKHNENFLQPDSDDGGEGSKRSLQWFMDWIREEHGDAKADWLWKRMGILCMRTLLSIIPILSKEYDQHFKSFSNIPVDLKELFSALNNPPGSTSPAPGTNFQPNSASGNGAGEGNSRGARMQSRNGAAKTDGNNNNNAETDEDNSGSEAAGDATNNNTNGGASGNGGAGEPQEESKYGENGPKIRGSRCFEVLGYDIMIDSNLNPWLIEVNHLPSFGTDSVLDRDIKERLMEQVFSVLPALPDDQNAFTLHHKVESAKRLNVQKQKNAILEKREKEAREKELRERPRPPLRPREPKRDLGMGMMKTDSSANSAEANARLEAEKAQQDARAAAANETTEEEEDIYEECTPERILEIKAILYDVYKKFSPEKLNKIDRLLAKYISHEEEFLRFVFNKYSVSPAMYKNGNFPSNSSQIPSVAEETHATAEAAELEESEGSPGDAPSAEATELDGEQEPDEEHDPEGEQQEENADTTEDAAERQEEHPSDHDGSRTARDAKTDVNIPVSRNQRETSKRASRSMSPQRSSSLANNSNGNNSNSTANKGRAAAAWKSTEQEDALFRTEVLAIHVPKDDDEWLLFETSRLTQFTRIFPLPKSAPSVSGSAGGAEASTMGVAEGTAPVEEAEVEEQPDEDEEDGTNKDTSAKNKVVVKSASYEEIIYQAFLADKRQTMRLRMPLPNRQKVIDDNVGSFLPPLDAPSSSRSSFSTIGSGKGAVGWKAPPKPAREAVVRQPTQGQSDAAKRLSQGLSVASTQPPRARYAAQSLVGMPNALASSGYSVVLDPTEFSLLNSPGSAGVPQAGVPGNPGAYPHGAYPHGAYANGGGQQQAGVAPGNPYQPVYGGIYPAFNRDGKPEAVWPSTKANRLLEESRMNRMRLEAAKANSNAVVRQQVFYFDPNYRDQLPGAMDASGLAQGSVAPGDHYYDASAQDDQGSVGTQRRNLVQPHGQGHPVQNPIGMSARPLMVASNRGRVMPAPHVRHASTGNMNMGSGVAGAGNHSQEELLRQLFPSWF